MKGTISVGFALLLVGGVACADHHVQPTFVGQSYSLIVSDPAALVAAMTKYRNSATGQKMQSQVVLSRNIANGQLEGTHTINVFYLSAAAMDAGMKLLATSPDTAEFRRAMIGAARPESDNVFTMLKSKINEGALTSDTPMSMLFGLNVTDQAAFMSSLNQIWESEAAGEFPGSMFFGQVIAMGDNNSTHWVSFQANDMQTLLAGVEAFMSSDDFMSYAKNASNFRSITNRSISQEVLRFEPPQEG